ncbi:putative aryl-alcohol dehydrogenase protein [Botryosphaeria dothidea]|uniref:Aryl-alcohol dehydrogenase protein n=1 Tax=Botryosphaeria dothidea TaxID=55169 RepID=A0A8H4IIA1_9PEZI|nr:putative aryl-alcohol dehydrogenase protein [Botryosphaeria dothidea]
MAPYTQTRAIVAKEPLDPAAPKASFVFETLEFDEPADDEVVIRMVASGICHSDIGFACMPGPDRVLGHEGRKVLIPLNLQPSGLTQLFSPIGAGYITVLGKSVTHLQVNDPVLLSYRSCGACPACSSTPTGRTHACPSILQLNFAHPAAFKRPDSATFDVAGRFFGQSSFANYSRAHMRSVVSMRDLVSGSDPDADLRLLAPLGCGFMTGAGTMLNALKAKPESAVLVTGMGAVGFGAVMVARLAGCGTVVALDRVGSRLRRAKEVGATHVIDTTELQDYEQIVEAVRAQVPEGVDGVVETTGADLVMQASMRVLRREGQVVFLAQGPLGAELAIPYKVLQYVSGKVNFSVMGEANPQDFVPKMVKWWREGKFPIEKLVEEYSIEEWKEAIGAMLSSGDVVKPVLVW